MMRSSRAAFRLLIASSALGIQAFFGTDASAASYTSLHSFGGPNDGATPEGTLIAVDGVVYGTTAFGGQNGTGTVFSISTAGAENVVYPFASSNDGSEPRAGLIDLNGTLYGTTMEDTFSDGYNSGTVFAMTAAGTERVVYEFKGENEPEFPVAPLLNVNGILYGTTYAGGDSSCNGGGGCGTVFSVTPDGKEKVLHSFTGGNDGIYPTGGLIYFEGKLYGTTNGGGAPCAGYGCGTVFSLTLKGSESIVYSFTGAGFGRTDGYSPDNGLLNVNGTFYGTTDSGGTKNLGTVFSVTPAGAENVIFSFTGNTTGYGPESGLVKIRDKLYGTTNLGGKYGSGTVFSVTPSGVEKVLVSFAGGGDGANPTSDLIDLNGTLYGTTPNGGGSGCSGSGCGTVFAVTP